MTIFKDKDIPGELTNMKATNQTQATINIYSSVTATLDQVTSCN